MNPAQSRILLRRSVPVRPKRRRRLAIAGIAAVGLAVWGLWAFGVILTGPVPLPATQISAVAAADSWALAGRDAAHTSAIPIHTGFEGREVWRIEMPEPLRAPPAVSGDQVFLGTGDNRFIAFDAANGQVIWERRLSLLTSTAPAVTSDAVYLTARSGELFALERHSGEELWRFEGDSAFFASPIVYRGVVYAGAWNGALYAVDAQDGRELWTFQADGSIIAPPAFQGDLMALPIDDRLVYVIDLSTGRKRLIFDAGHVLVESPVFTGDLLIISTGRGRLWAVDWTKLEYPFERGFRYWRNQFYIWRMQADPPFPKGFVWTRWLARDHFLSAPAVLDGVAYAASQDGRLHALSVSDGERLWEYDTGTRVHTAPAVAGAFVYVGTDAGEVHVVDRATGKADQIIPIGAGLRGQIVATETGLYVTSREPAALVALR